MKQERRFVIGLAFPDLEPATGHVFECVINVRTARSRGLLTSAVTKDKYIELPGRAVPNGSKPAVVNRRLHGFVLRVGRVNHFDVDRGIFCARLDHTMAKAAEH